MFFLFSQFGKTCSKSVAIAFVFREIHCFGQNRREDAASPLPRIPGRDVRSYSFAISTAVSSAISIICVKVLCLSAGGSSSPVTRLSEMDRMVSARLPV